MMYILQNKILRIIVNKWGKLYPILTITIHNSFRGKKTKDYLGSRYKSDTVLTESSEPVDIYSRPFSSINKCVNEKC